MSLFWFSGLIKERFMADHSESGNIHEHMDTSRQLFLYYETKTCTYLHMYDDS